MKRLSRSAVAGMPRHVVQQGRDRHACFDVTDDFRRYLAWLCDSFTRYGCVMNADVLMNNHAHLAMTRSADDAGE